MVKEEDILHLNLFNSSYTSLECPDIFHALKFGQRHYSWHYQRGQQIKYCLACWERK